MLLTPRCFNLAEGEPWAPEKLVSNYGGMTVNERLFAAGLLDAFDNCIKNLDDDGAVGILVKVELSPDEAIGIIAAIRQNPAKYGHLTG